MQAGCSVTCLQSCPLQMFGLQWSTSNTWLVLLSLSCSHSLFLSRFYLFSLSWAERTDTLFSPHSFIPLSGICVSCFIPLSFSAFVTTASPLSSFPQCPLSVTVTGPSLALLALCISISGLACLLMMRFDPPCWMILTWYPTSGRFLSRLTSPS